MRYILLFSLSLLLSMGLTWLVRNLAKRRGWVSAPVLDRHVHTEAVPRLGGVPIFATVLVITGLFGRQFIVQGAEFPVSKFAALLGAGGLVFLVGLYDDLRGLKPGSKLAMQVVAALILFANGFRIEKLRFFGAHEFGIVLSLALTVFWVLLVTNALNLMDGLDGLATGAALFPICALSIVSVAYPNPVALFMAIVLGGALVGFLRFNFCPASIFLGDCGSLLIGFMLSALALESSQKAVIAMALAGVSLGLPLADTGLAVLRRFLNGRPIFSGDREHIHHKLLQRGLTQTQAALLLYGVSAILGALSLLLLRPSLLSIALVAVVVVAGTTIGLRRLGYHEFDELRRIARRTVDQKAVIINDLAFHSAIDQLRNADTFARVCIVMQQAFEGNDFDGFEFIAEPYCSGLQFTDLGRFMRSQTGQLRFEWQRSNGQPLALGPVWSLQLELPIENHRTRGWLRIYRGQTRGALLVDLNLLTSEFNVALADALNRAINKADIAFTPSGLAA
jgi:UDP-GlcNAc:undecaprenyl-phosphate GlcNAc-1-phosphate transferase